MEDGRRGPSGVSVLSVQTGAEPLENPGIQKEAVMQQQANIDQVTVKGKEGERVAKVQISYMVNSEDNSEENTEELMRLQGLIVNVRVDREG
jgi:flagellar basal body-associated protein FliL